MSLFRKRTPDLAHQKEGSELAWAANKRQRLKSAASGSEAWKRVPQPRDQQRVVTTQEQPPSPREIQVLGLIADGLTNVEIAQVLFLSPETVKSHVRHLLAKMQARSRAHAVGIAFRQGLLSTGSRSGSSGPTRTSPPPYERR